MRSLLRTVSIILITAMLLTGCFRLPFGLFSKPETAETPEAAAFTAMPTRAPTAVPTAARTAAPTEEPETPAPERTPKPTPTPEPAETGPDIGKRAYQEYLGAGSGAFKEGYGEPRTPVPAVTPDPSEGGEDDGGQKPSNDGESSRLLAKKNQTYDRSASKIGALTADFPDKKDYTLMVYMIGSNLESAQGSATKDIQEMLGASLDYGKINLILYTGGSTRWNTDIPCDRNCVVDLSRNTDSWVVASTEKNADMGAPDVLSEFVNFTTDRYPADHYALIFWDHGGGPLFGYGSDELFNGDGLLLTEMYEAMGSTVFSQKGKLDFVGFDACLMGSLENMAVWRSFANYYVGSEELEPGDGWDYGFLSVLNQTYDPVTISRAIVDRFQAYYDAKRSEYYDPDLTLSVADLSKIPAVQTAWTSASSEMTEALKRDGLYIVNRDRQDTKGYGYIGGSEEEGSFSYDLMDLKDFSRTSVSLSQDTKDALAGALDELIIYSYSNLERAGGVTVYYPFHNPAQYTEMRDVYQDLGNSEYLKYLAELSRAKSQDRTSEFKLPALVFSGEDYTMTFTEEQVREISSVTYSILNTVQPGSYYTSMSQCRVPIGEDGVAHFERDPELLTLKSDYGFHVWRAQQLDQNASRTVYQTVDTRFESTGVNHYSRLSMEFTDISVTLSRDNATGKLSIQTINTLSPDAAFSGKDTVDVSHFDAIYYFFNEMLPVWTDEGDLLPVADWKKGGINGHGRILLDQSFSFDMIHISELDSELYYVVTVEDIYGRQHTLEPVKIEPEKPFYEKEVPTENGTMTFSVYEDHAVITGYSGRDTEVTVPDSVDSRPVTEVGTSAFAVKTLYSYGDGSYVEKVVLPDTIEAIKDSAFQFASKLKEIHIPGSVRTIGSNAFEGCTGLEEITVPEGVTTIGPYAFSECSALKTLRLPSTLASLGKGLTGGYSKSLEKIELPETCAAYRLADGAVLTADGTRLLAYPAARTGSYTVPATVRVIDSDAFACSLLTEVILPEGLESIGNYAFYRTPGLHAPVLPESLTTIGKYAFNGGWGNINFSEAPAEPYVIRIGKNVSYIGKNAFTGFPCRRFEVDPANPYYSAVQGSLMNKAGDALVELAANRSKNYIVPEGCVNFDLSIMSQANEYNSFDNGDPFHVFIPDSVIRIQLSGSTTFLKYLIFHCPAGSYAEERARILGIPVSYDTEPALSVHVEKSEHQEATYLLYDDHAAWVYYEGDLVSFALPEEVAGLPVTTVGNGYSGIEGDYYGTHVLKRVKLTDKVTTIRDYAFQYVDLESMDLPDSILHIGAQSLGNLEFTKLPPHLESLGFNAFGSSMKFREGVDLPSSIRFIAPGAFDNDQVTEFRMQGESDFCKIIDGMLYSKDGTILLAGACSGDDPEIVIPEGTLAIGAYAFSNSRIKKVAFPDSLVTIGDGAFLSSQLAEIQWGTGLKYIGEQAFKYLYYMEEIVLPEGIVEIGKAAFHGVHNLKRAEIRCQILGESAFYGCSRMTEVILHEGILEIRKEAFSSTTFSKITLPESLTFLGERALGAYPYRVEQRLEEDAKTAPAFVMKIPKNLRTIEQGAFMTMPITAFEVDPDNPEFKASGGMLTDRTGRLLYACPSGISGKAVIPDGVIEVLGYSFYGCSFLTDVYFPASVQSISSISFDTSTVGSEKGYGPITFHAPKGSAAAQLAVKWNWPYSES